MQDKAKLVHRGEQNKRLAADGAIVCFSSKPFPAAQMLIARRS